MSSSQISDFRSQYSKSGASDCLQPCDRFPPRNTRPLTSNLPSLSPPFPRRGCSSHLLAHLRVVPRDELVEIALLTARGVLEDQGQAALVELLEEVVPGDRLEGVFATETGEVDPQHADVAPAASAAHARRLAAALLGPLADLVMVDASPRAAAARARTTAAAAAARGLARTAAAAAPGRAGRATR